MDETLRETEDFLRNYRKDGPLPQGLLLLIADLVRPAPVLSLDEDLLESDALIAKDQHLLHLSPLLALAQQIVPLLPAPTDLPSREDLDLWARLLLIFGRYTQESVADVFTTAEARKRALSISSLLLTPRTLRLPLIRHTVSVSLPSFFKPHPRLNPATGRVLSRPAGGDRGVQDWYDEGEDDGSGWRRQAGMAGVVRTLIETLSPGEVEDLWPLLLPPLLSYLDDYETKNKIVGTGLLNALLDRVDASLLRRTGVGKVFEKSLDSCFTTLSDPHTAILLSSAHPVALKLLNLQYPTSSFSSTTSSQLSTSDEPRLNALFSLLTSAILHAWEFKSSHVDIETVTAQHLPSIVDSLGPAVIRYLQILVPHLSDLLAQTATAAGGTWTKEAVRMMIAAAGALESVVRNGRARMSRWAGKIGGAVAQAWVGLKESERAGKVRHTDEGKEQIGELEEALIGLTKALAVATGEGKVAERLKGAGPALEGLLPVSTEVASEA
ncbi:hypothetical protein JCM11251_001589 [Rhodosporidiobolus azoricus]